MPTLVLAWGTDPGHPLSTAEDLVELIPGAELEVAGQLADVVSWTDRVEEFLDRRRAGADLADLVDELLAVGERMPFATAWIVLSHA